MMPLLLQLMLNQPMSSDMMNRMFGFFCAAMTGSLRGRGTLKAPSKFFDWT
jgi:hypothetical protein